MEVIPVINKIDLPSAQPEQCKKQIEDVLAIPADDAILASGKSGIGINEILDAVVKPVPPPRNADYPATRALIFDCMFDAYKGVICYVRVFSGSIKAGDEILLMGGRAKNYRKGSRSLYAVNDPRRIARQRLYRIHRHQYQGSFKRKNRRHNNPRGESRRPKCSKATKK